MATYYERLIAEVDQSGVDLAAHYRAHVACRAGCCSCCRHDLSVFEVEADAVRRAVLGLPEAHRARIVEQAKRTRELKELGRRANCPLLVDSRCSIYRFRPIICRTQGLPLLITKEDGTQEVDFCPFNFSNPGATAELDPQRLLDLEPANVKLVIANLLHCRASGIDTEAAGRRKCMSEIVLEL
jgi:Fe-S-cluster containining protein